jgi:hypothetical protein
MLRGAVLPTSNGTDAGEEHKMSPAAKISEPINDLGADPGQPQASPVHNMIKG